MNKEPKHPWRSFDRAALGGLVTCFACGGTGQGEGLVWSCHACDGTGYLTPEEHRAMLPKKRRNDDGT